MAGDETDSDLDLTADATGAFAEDVTPLVHPDVDLGDFVPAVTERCLEL